VSGFGKQCYASLGEVCDALHLLHVESEKGSAESHMRGGMQTQPNKLVLFNPFYQNKCTYKCKAITIIIVYKYLQGFGEIGRDKLNFSSKPRLVVVDWLGLMHREGDSQAI